MKLTSSAFDHEGSIPSKYTCDGENISPPLKIEDVPAETKSLVLIMKDPDVPKNLREDGTWIHWVVFNIPTDVTEIPEGSEPKGTQGNTTYDKPGYGGPCPPDREHRYFTKIFALDTMLDLPEGSTASEVLKAIEGHVIKEAVLMGRYNRN